MTSTEQAAKAEAEKQLRSLGFSVSRSSRRNLQAINGSKQFTIKIRGLKGANAIFLKESDLEGVDVLIIHVINENKTWVLPRDEAQRLLDQYKEQYSVKHRRSPKAEGFNKGRLPPVTGWSKISSL